MPDEKMLWDQQDGESNRWYQRFCAYRLLGPGRSVSECVRQEKASKSKEKPKYTPGSWSKAADRWQWKARAEAWDKHIIEQADAAVEREWREKIMGETEVLGRMSEYGRNDMGQFFKVCERWTETPLPSEEILEEQKYPDLLLGIERTRYLVRKAVLDMDAFLDPVRSRKIRKFTDSPKNGLGIELHDPAAAQVNLGRHYKIFSTVNDDAGQGVDAHPFSLPADVLAPSFIRSYRAVKSGKYTEFLEYGGRGSTKSSFISLTLVELLENNPTMHALVMRQVSDTLRDSVYAQIKWAIGELGLMDEFKCLTSPMEITYLPTGQKIYFRGANDPGSIKSIKAVFGYIGLLWFEEIDQLHGAEAVRKIEQSIRGGEKVFIFKSWNPPRTTASWVSKYIQIPKPSQYQHASNYLDVPEEWLGQPWLDEAEHLKTVNPGAYEHEYLGVPNGNGGMVFENVVIRKITDEEIIQFDQVTYGGDWGFFPDPSDFGPVHFDAARRILYLFGEHRVWKQTNLPLYAGMLRALTPPVDSLMILDSAEPKSVADFRQYASDGIPILDAKGNPVLNDNGKPVLVYGPSCRGAEKGPDSVKYSMKWLQGLTAIVIDPARCPYAAQEFLDYEYERDKDNNVISEYPDKNNHSIDRVRYATNLIWKRRGQ